MHASAITRAAAIHNAARQYGLTLGARENASMKAIQVKNTAWPLG
jgi:hypothetical protein